ncbi:MAG: SGNH/GDSL hydrolase family protein [Hyphomicrobiales bacterium]
MVDASSPRQESAWRTVAINVLVFFFLMGATELAARLYIAWTYGTQTAGMQERIAYLAYRPFVMYGPDWDQVLGSLQPPKNNVCRVMMVGGSVAAGFSNDVLERALSAQYEQSSFEIVNAAYGGYEARQEVIVASLWGPRLKPNLLLSLDGTNDLEHRLRVKKAGEFYLSPSYEAFLDHPLLAPLYFLASHSQAYNAILRIVSRLGVGPVEQYSDSIPIYIDAQKSLNQLAGGMGAARLMVLQPFSGYKSQLSKEESAFTLFKYREDVMKELYALASDQMAATSKRDGVPYLDGRSLFVDVADHIFTDDVHLTLEGYRRLAKAIATTLGSVWPARCSH